MKPEKIKEILALAKEGNDSEAMFEMLKASASISTDILNNMMEKQLPDAIVSLSLLGAAIAISKTGDFVSLEEFIKTATWMWQSQIAEYVTEPIH